jgi:proteasome lid subunit RPN8/RPN11
MPEGLTEPVEASFGIWSREKAPVSVQYLSAAMDDIRIQVVDAFHCVPRGGLEIGGVLFGKLLEGSPARVSIEAHRKVECEHAYGPSFLLSEQDQARFQELLAGYTSDPELRDLVPVGWYHSHTRSDIFLSAEDVEIYGRFFPEPWQIALILRPVKLRPTRAAFFFRESDGSIRTQSPYEEISLFPIPRRKGQGSGAGMWNGSGGREEASTDGPQRDPAEGEESSATGTEQPAEPGEMDDGDIQAIRSRIPPALVEIPAGARRTSVWTWLAWLLTTGAAALAVVAWAEWGVADQPQLRFRALDHEGQLRLDWDRTARVLANAEGASIAIEDGGSRSTLQLTPADLRNGTITYARRSGNVILRMRVLIPGGSPTEEITHFIGEPVPESAATNPPRGREPQIERLESEIERLRGQLEQSAAQNRELQRRADSLERQIRLDRLERGKGAVQPAVN